MKYDIAIIGAGPGGLTAALYCARAGLKTVVISKDIGGTTNSILKLENWPGYEGPGSKLMMQFYEQVKKYGNVEFFSSICEKIIPDKKGFIINTKDKTLQSKVIILASGTERRKLKIPGEQEFLGKGVSYCSTCDGFFFKNKIVGVIGGSDCAAVSALALSDLAKKVYVIYRKEKLRAEEINIKRLEKKKNIEIIYNAIPKEILGTNKVDKIKVEIKDKEQIIDLEGVFIEIGSVPNFEFARELKLKLDKDDFIIIDDNMQTSHLGVFAAGDLTNQKLKQVVIAAAQGAIAAKNAYDWLSGKKE